MDAAAAIAELRELSTQIETVVVAPREGSPIASSVRDEEALRMVESARALADGAEQVCRDLGRDALAQLQAATPDGSVFVVVDEQRMAVATTGIRWSSTTTNTLPSGVDRKSTRLNSSHDNISDGAVCVQDK